MILTVVHVIIAILLMAGILMQNRSSGLSSALGGQMGATNVVQRRGAEKAIYKVTIWLAIAFFALTIVRWYVHF